MPNINNSNQTSQRNTCHILPPTTISPSHSPPPSQDLHLHRSTHPPSQSQPPQLPNQTPPSTMRTLSSWHTSPPPGPQIPPSLHHPSSPPLPTTYPSPPLSPPLPAPDSLRPVAQHTLGKHRLPARSFERAWRTSDAVQVGGSAAGRGSHGHLGWGAEFTGRQRAGAGALHGKSKWAGWGWRSVYIFDSERVLIFWAFWAFWASSC
ncbi:hypothetical protein EJ04DRAFT_130310 [Polyplosphaeria fusca]|uniref:Uncharacterized protein n=1 Tax=Polyplosphaeria fusca TaxID=682080 RepID=A0A9P4V3Z2_9PLEO|nr:hypothetical protein EJ04DRAFT_130310 [Polyplosphaeria fusca]